MFREMRDANGEHLPGFLDIEAQAAAQIGEMVVQTYRAVGPKTAKARHRRFMRDLERMDLLRCPSRK